MKRWKLLMMGLAAVALVFGTMSTALAKKATVVYGTTDKVTDMDPANAYDFHTWEIFENIFQGLLGYPAGETKLVPQLATGYTVSPDGKVYTFKLRQGVKFSDGTPFDANTVKWSIDRVMRLKGDPSWLVTTFVSSVKVINSHTVEFILKHPCAFFPALVATPPYFPVDPKIYPADKIIGNPSELKGGKLVGLGPYECTSFKRDEEIVLDANPNFYGEKPKNDRIVIRTFADATTMRLALQRGDLDFAFKSLNPSDIKSLMKHSKLNTIKGQGPFIRYLCFQCQTPPFNDKVVRQAVAAAIDRPQIIRKVYLGLDSPLYSMVPKGMWTHTDYFKTTLGDGNIKLARKLLASRGFNAKHKLKFTLWYTTSHYGDSEVDLAAVIRKQMEATGVMKVNVRAAEWATYKQNYEKKIMPVYLLGWYPDYIDPDDYTAAFASTTASAGNGIFFSSPVWDALFTAEESNPNQKDREAILKYIQKMWTVEVPTVPIFQGNLYLFSQKNVRGIKISPTLQLLYSPIHFVK